MTNKNMTTKEFYHDYKLICKMKVPLKSKAEMLTILFKNYEKSWRVIGITKEALKRFKEYNFKKTKGSKINRSHINGRQDTFEVMMNTNFESIDKWWDFYYENDKTIFSLSSENAKVGEQIFISIDNELGLFKRSGYTWSHNKAERDYLESLYECHINSLI